ncbi:MAG: 3-dehydroquinate synthase family protein, partial [Gemmatimonadales bacterium]
MNDSPASESVLRVGVPTAPAPTYPVRLERGAFRRLGEIVAELGDWSRVIVVADATVAALYGEDAVRSLEAAGMAATLETFAAGEAAKSRSTWSELTDRLLAAGLGRDGLVVALGGGVTGDLAGFVAATYMRGLPWVVAPTSLLAMLDSAVGGKTAVDTPDGKNLVGAFHHPRLVVADPDLLATLPPAHVRAGLAEGVKTAAIRDVGLFEWMEEHAAELRGGDT